MTADVVKKRAVIRGYLFKFLVCLCLGLPGPSYAQEENDVDFEDEIGSVPDIGTARATLKQTLSPGASRDEEVRYWLARERAAFAAGAGAIRLESLRRLVELHQGTPQVYRYWGSLWREEWRSGNQQRAFEIGEQILASNVPNLYLKTVYAAHLAWDYMETGQRSQAWSAIDRAERFAKEYAQSANSTHLDRITATIGMHRGRLLLQDGRYTDSETTLRTARQAALRAIEQSRKTGEREGFISFYEGGLRIRDNIAGIHMRLLSTVGRHVEAEAMARQALQESTTDRPTGDVIGFWHERIALAKLAQRRYAEALTLSDQAIEIFTKSGLSSSANRMLWARNTRLRALLGLERWADAEAEYAAMLAATAGDAVGRRYVSLPVLEALLNALTGKSAQALERIERVVRFRGRIYGEKHPLTIEAKAVQAVAQQAAGNSGAALGTYREVFGVLFAEDALQLDTATRGLRGFYLPLALQHYLKLVATLAVGGQLTPDLMADAFVVADRLRESVVQQAVIDSATRALVESNPALSDLVRKEQNLRTSMQSIYNNMIRRDREIQDLRREVIKLREQKTDASKLVAQVKVMLKEMQADRTKLEPFDQQQRELRRQLAQQFPAYHRLVNPVPVRPANLAKRLRPDEALVSIYSTDSHSFVWAVKSGAEPLLHIAGVGAESIARDVIKLRATLDLEGRSSPLPYDVQTAHRLYSLLLQPVENAWAGQRVLTVIASGPLGQIPFALLTTKPSDGHENAVWLVNDVAIAHIGSASAWASVRDSAGKISPRKPFLGFGDPQFAATPGPAAPADVRALLKGVGRSLAAGYAAMPALPETRHEIISIAKALGADVEQSAFFGPSASRAQVMKSNPLEHRVVAFATHGLRAGDMEMLSQPALAMAVTQNPNEAPFLTLDDVLKLKVAAELVVLSACNTASDDGANEEAISGLGRGFFFAGARSLLLTHWAVETRSAQALVTNFFTQDKVSRAERLRNAQLQMIKGAVDQRYRHPAFWAPYALVGDPSM